MSKTKTYRSDAAAAIHELISDLHEIGLVDRYTMRGFDESCLTPVEELTPEQIKAIRTETQASQTAFARHLNVTPLVINQWESGKRKPSAPALKLLTLVKNKGLECIA